jgi:PKD repeat protein
MTIVTERLPIGIEGTTPEGKAPSIKAVLVIAILIIASFLAIYFLAPLLPERTPKIPTVENKPPSANFSYLPAQPVIGSPVRFIDESHDHDGEIVNWTWHFGDGNMSYELSPTHVYEYPGTYLVILHVKDNDNATSQKNLTLTVVSSYRLEKSGTIEGSSSSSDSCYEEHYFNVQESAVWLNITLTYTITQGPLHRASQVDIYLYYYDTENKTRVNVTQVKGAETTKTIVLSEEQIVAYGKWIVKLHHYSNVSTGNTADYDLVVEIVYSA